MSDSSRFDEIVEAQNEKREQPRDETSFDRCKKIKRLGEFYRDTTISEVANEFDLSRPEARGLIVEYVKLVNDPTGRVSWEVMSVGIDFYGGQCSLDEILDETESPVEDVQSYICEFVGMTLSERNQDIDLRSVSIPEDRKYPEEVMQEFNSASETVTQINRQVTEPIRSIATQLSSILQDIREQLEPIIQHLQELAEDVRRAIKNEISNFNKPDDYDPLCVQLNSLARHAGAQYLDKVLENICDVDEHPLAPYQNRLKTGIQDFRDGRFFTPIFSFISVQDGIMHWLCEQENVEPDYENRFGDPVYSWDTKCHKLAELNEEWYGVCTGDFISNLESFYAHRNAIMHGDPVAFFDENIATISMLFLSMTLETALHYSDGEGN